MMFFLFFQIARIWVLNFNYLDFCSNINSRTKEILFEVYSKAKKENEKNQFLGLAIVSVQELLESPTQRQVISLQSRPYQNDKVSGTLTLEVRSILYIIHISCLHLALPLVFNSLCSSSVHIYHLYLEDVFQIIILYTSYSSGQVLLQIGCRTVFLFSKSFCRVQLYLYN